MSSIPDEAGELGYAFRGSHGEPTYAMTLDDMEAYIRKHTNGIAGFVYLDGFITAQAISPNDYPLGATLQALFANSSAPPDEENPEHANFCGAVLGRYLEIHQCLADYSPVPVSTTYSGSDGPEIVFLSRPIIEVLPDYPNAYQPVLVIPSDGTPRPTRWAQGFHAFMEQTPDLWVPFRRMHPEYHWHIGYIMYFLPNRARRPTNKAFKNHSDVAVSAYINTGITADVIATYHYFKPMRDRSAALS